MDSITEAVLTATRKINRATDIYSSHIRRSAGLSAPQILLLRAVQEMPSATAGELAQKINLSQATTTTILDRLEVLELVKRYRSDKDRRKVHVSLTSSGCEALKEAPLPLQVHFIEQFENLRPFERTAILSALQQVVDMMEVPLSEVLNESMVSQKDENLVTE